MAGVGRSVIMLKRIAKPFFPEERGAVLVETLIVAPVFVLMIFGFVEFGNALWQREQLQAGVRDAARYWSRCRQTVGGAATDCSEAVARNIAFYGSPSPGSSPVNRVPGWDGSPANELEILPAKGDLPGDPIRSDLVEVTGRMEYRGFLLRGPYEMSYRAEMRYIGW